MPLTGPWLSNPNYASMLIWGVQVCALTLEVDFREITEKQHLRYRLRRSPRAVRLASPWYSIIRC